jgi:DNA mismatch repair endonuclease MutH
MIDIKFETEEALLERAGQLKGKSISEIFQGEINEKNKGNIGNIIESNGFGIKNNSDARPDFETLGIELKILPLKRLGDKSLTVKERTKICLINYKKLIAENWNGSHARHKLNKILFVFHEYDGKYPMNSKILNHLLYKLEMNEEPLIRSDWERTKKLVDDGLAHTLSESQNRILAASRSGAGKLTEDQWPEQPNQTYSRTARQRSFSLKPSYTKTLWSALQNKKEFDRIMDIASYESYEELEKIILERLNRWKGHTLAEFSKVHGINPGKGKNAESSILRKALGFEEKGGPIKEILEMGLKVKMIPARKSDMYPFEAMSFPFQPLGELAEEERFDDSDFYTYLQGFLLIPLIRESREDKRFDKVFFGKSFIWRPSHDELVLIQSEWEQIRDVVRAGIHVKKKATKSKRGYIQQNNLPGESETKCIYMRPHARDADDLDESANVRICKQSLWFNKSFIQRKLLESKSN